MATEQENVLFTGNIDLGVSKLAAIGAEKAVALKHEYVLPEHLVVEFVEHLLLIYPELREYVDLKSLKTLFPKCYGTWFAITPKTILK